MKRVSKPPKPTDAHRALEQKLRVFLDSKRGQIVGIDGLDSTGKSTLARYMAWRLGIACLETDLFTAAKKQDDGKWTFDTSDHMATPINKHTGPGRHIIVEGIFLRDRLALVGAAPDYSIYVEKDGHTGFEDWQKEYAEYAARIAPKAKADAVHIRPKDRFTIEVRKVK